MTDEYAIVLRLILAAICGGILGFERERKKRPAGLRTYILVCVGAALVMLTNQYIFEEFGGLGDPTRMAAQVISGIGFLGAGTIIVTSRSRVKGLTTAAGLWAAACMGLAIGSGFYIGAVTACLIIFMTASLLHHLDYRMGKKSRIMTLYVELKAVSMVGEFMRRLKEMGIKVIEMDIHKEAAATGQVSVSVSLQLAKRGSHEEIIAEIGKLEGLTFIEEI